jgi:hypothetical protein
MQLATTLRTTIAATIPTDLGATAFARFYSSSFSVKVATAALSNPAFVAGAAGVQDLDVTPVVEDASPLAGTVDRVGLYQNTTDTSALWRLLFGVNPTGTPDITMANNVVATTDTVQLSSLEITVPVGVLDQT